MSISPFFTDLRSAYQSELDDLRFDSEGRDVLRQRLADKRQELGFLVKMMELSPEMVAVVLHQGFNFRLPAVMDHLLTHEADEFPEWSSFSDAVGIAPWAQDMADVVLQEPGGEWFMTVAAGLEYMAGRPVAGSQASSSDDTDEEEDGDSEGEQDLDEDQGRSSDDAGDGDARSREEAGGDWLADQGFDRKD
jgi:hypothetical protein